MCFDLNIFFWWAFFLYGVPLIIVGFNLLIIRYRKNDRRRESHDGPT